MIVYDLTTQGPHSGSSIIDFMQYTASSATFSRVTGLFAYATKSGVNLFVDALSQSMSNWRYISKRWVVSIDFGLTDPEALELLASLNRSEVRVPYFHDVLKRQFKPVTCFHPKTLVFDTNVSSRKGPYASVVGSANLTFSGLTVGHENAMSVICKNPKNREEKNFLNSFIHNMRQIDAIYSMASPVNTSMIRRYKRMRPKRRAKSEDDNPSVKRLTEVAPEIPPRKAVSMATAANFWVDVKYVVENLGRGVPGNQIDLQRGSRVFFGFGVGQVRRNTILGNVKIRYKRRLSNCHMRFGNNYMDKLNLPIPVTEGPRSYDNETLLFHRLADGSFELHVGTKNDIKLWKKVSRSQGTFFKMQSGRPYGVFS
jgi:HKD family nuclease